MLGLPPSTRTDVWVFPQPFVHGRQDKEETFKLFHSMEAGEIPYWLDFCERMIEVPFKALLRTACLLMFFPGTAGLASVRQDLMKKRINHDSSSASSSTLLCL